MDETVNIWQDDGLNAEYEMSVMENKLLTLRYAMTRINNASQND